MIGILLLAMACTAVASADVVTNATEMGARLNAGLVPVTLEPIAAQRGCGRNGCLVVLGTVTILQDGHRLQAADGRTIRLVQHAPGDPSALPAMNWDPLQSFDVIAGGHRWGQCVEFAHAGVANSGSFQRWRTVVLIPQVDDRKKSVAHRFVGYWVGCDQLTQGERSGEVLLPLVEPVAVHKAELHLAWQRCAADRCDAVVDQRIVRREPGSEAGALVVGGP